MIPANLIQTSYGTIPQIYLAKNLNAIIFRVVNFVKGRYACGIHDWNRAC